MISSSSSGWSPSGRESSPETRAPTTKSRPTAPRTASRISSEKRMRFSRLPPYWSVRRLMAGLQNWSGSWSA